MKTKLVLNDELLNKELTVSVNYLQMVTELSANEQVMSLIIKFMSTKFEDINKNDKFIAKIFFLKDLAEDVGIKVCRAEVVNNHLKEHGYRAAAFEEMLATLICFGELKEIPMVAFGSHAFVSGSYCDYSSPVSLTVGENWILKEDYFDNSLSIGHNLENYFFLAVKI